MPAHRSAAWRIRRLVTDTGGATLIEYAAITFLVSIVLGFVLPNFGDAVEGLYERTSSVLAGIGSDQRDDKSGDGDDRDGRGGRKHGGRGGRHHD